MSIFKKLLILANIQEHNFKEQDHPRRSDGEFTKKGSGQSKVKTPSEPKSLKTDSLTHTTKVVNKKRVNSDGSELPDHIQKLRIPPAWTEFKYNPNPKADLIGVGLDAKGRRQSVYSAEFANSQAAIKFARIDALSKDFNKVKKQNDKNCLETDLKLSDQANCLDLIIKTGIRPGSNEDTSANEKAYGATTLLGQHVVAEGKNVYLRFVGKKSVKINLPIKDPNVANKLLERAKIAGEGGKLFPHVTDKSLLLYVHKLSNKKFKTKDFRTLLANKSAMHHVGKMQPPKTMKEYKKAVNDVAKQVAARLGNTPVVCLQSYISPACFSQWLINVKSK